MVQRRDDETVEELPAVRRVLAEIGAEEGIARLESRIVELEQDIERAGAHTEAAERARRGEFEVMRARVDDTLEVVRSATDEHQQAWSHLERRLAALVAETEANTGRLVAALREELAPRVHRAAFQSDELEARLRGELEAVTGDAISRSEEAVNEVNAMRGRLEKALADLRAEHERAIQAREAAMADFEQNSSSWRDEIIAAAASRVEEFAARVEELRRELDAAIGELRATQNLRAKELNETIADLRGEVQEAVRDEVAAINTRAGELAGVVDALRTDLQRSFHEQVAQLDARATHLDEAFAQLSAEVHQNVDQRLQAADARTAELAQALTTLRADVHDVVRQEVANASGRVEELASSLAAVREEMLEIVQAEVSARAAGDQEFDQSLDGLRNELIALVRDQVTAAAAREQEWMATATTREEQWLADVGAREETWTQATTELAHRVEDSVAAANAQILRERTARDEADLQLRTRIDQLANRLEQIDGRTVAATGRHLAELAQLHRGIEELVGRTEVLGTRVSTAVEEVSGSLAARVGSLSGEIEAIREGSVRQQERLAAIDRLTRHAADLARRHDDLAARLDARDTETHGGASSDEIAALRRQVAQLTERLETAMSGQPTSAATAALEELVRGQEALRREVRELASRSSELATRVDQAEALSRAAGKAITAAVRRVRPESGGSDLGDAFTSSAPTAP